MSEADSQPGAGWITANFTRMMHTDLDLSQASVFLDFDGTISTVDVVMHLLERAASPEWWQLHEQFERGEIGSRECILGEWALVDGDPAMLRAVAAEVALDSGFVPLVDAVRDAGAELVVVSDGFGFYVHDVCAPLGIDVLTNAVDFATGELRFPHEDLRCACSACGMCKQAPIRDAQRRGRTTVLIGDGTSDRQAASLADVVFAKDPLASWCSSSGVAYTPFATLDDVRGVLFP
jgi:2-hydroxy-3-keto-5-methylthiopentenyl-1-phosphate phosphatase